VKERFREFDSRPTYLRVNGRISEHVRFKRRIREYTIDQPESKCLGRRVFKALRKQLKALFLAEIPPQDRRYHRGHEPDLDLRIAESSGLGRNNKVARGRQSATARKRSPVYRRDHRNLHLDRKSVVEGRRADVGGDGGRRQVGGR